MATDYTADPFEEWSQPEQDLWLGMIESSGHSELQDDDTLQWLYDVAFNTDRGDIPGDHRAGMMEAMYEYIQDVYGFDFHEHFDWEAWREAYGSD